MSSSSSEQSSLSESSFKPSEDSSIGSQSSVTFPSEKSSSQSSFSSGATVTYKSSKQEHDLVNNDVLEEDKVGEMDFTRDPSRLNTVIKDSSFESANNTRIDKKPAGQSSYMPEDGLTED